MLLGKHQHNDTENHIFFSDTRIGNAGIAKVLFVLPKKEHNYT